MEWEWYDDIPTKVLFLHMLFRANHKPKKWHGMDVNRGQFISGRKKLSEETGLSEQQIRTATNKLKSTGELTIKSTKTFTLYTIENYSKYQNREHEATKEATNKQPTSNQQATTNKNVKNDKKVNIPPVRTDVYAYFTEKGSPDSEAHKFLDYYTSNGWMVGKNKMKDWKAAARGWISRNQSNQPKQTGFNTGELMI